MRELEKQMSTTAQSMQKDMENVKRVSTAAGVALLGLGAAGGAVIVKSTLLAARVETLGIVLMQVGKNAGYTESQLNHFEASTIAMGITAQAARTSLTRLAQAEIDLAAGADLARIAQDAAVIANINSSEAFERMIYGIQTLNPRVLKTLGLTISLEQAYSKFAKTAGITISELTMQQKKQVALNEVMAAGVRISGTYEAAMETAGKKALSLARHFEAAQVAIGNEFLPVYTQLIDLTTDLIKWFNDLAPETQSLIAVFLGVGTAVALVSGAVLILLPQLGMLTGLAASVGTTFLMSGAASVIMGEGMWLAAAGAGGLGTALTGLLAITGIGLLLAAVAVGATLLGKALMDTRQEAAAHLDQLQEEERSLVKTSSSYANYINTLQQTAKANDQILIVGGKVLQWSTAQTRGTVNMDNALQGVTETVWGANRAFSREVELLTNATDNYQAYIAAADPMAVLQAENEARTAALNEEMATMAFIMQNEVGPSMEEHNERLKDLNNEASEVNQQIIALEERKYLTTQQEEELETLHGELRNITEQIAEENAAWEKNAAMILYNFAQRALADAPLAVQSAILGQMAQDMGLMDETSAAIWNDMTAAIEAGLASGNWDLAQNMIGNMFDKLTNWPSYVHTTIEIDTFGSFGGGDMLSSGGDWVNPSTGTNLGSTGTTERGVQEGAAMGGLFDPGTDGIIEVGEAGSELLVPLRGGGYMVIPNELTRRFKAKGIRAGRHMQGGGGIPEFAYSGDVVGGTRTRGAAGSGSYADVQRRLTQDVRLGRSSGAGGATIGIAIQQATIAAANVATQASTAAVQTAMAPMAVQLAAQAQIATRQATELARSNREMAAKMDELILAVRAGATDEGVAEGTATALQFFEG